VSSTVSAEIERALDRSGPSSRRAWPVRSSRCVHKATPEMSMPRTSGLQRVQVAHLGRVRIAAHERAVAVEWHDDPHIP
jgi:hypothetical protein